MKPAITSGVLVPLILVGVVLAPTRGSGQDHPLLSRMPGFHVDDSEERGFDSYDFRLADGSEVQVEGRLYYLDYGLDEGERVPSELQILRNHTNAIETIGGEVLFTDGANAYLKSTSEGLETWVHVRVYNQATAYSLNIVERQTMVQEVEANAETMARDISTTGRTAIYGISFDFDKADIKPESGSTLAEIARLLREQPDLRLHVVGHTDNVGQFDYNMDLSRRRAEAVVEALTSGYGVVGERLRAAGVGPLAPAAPNTADEGRARNRRVELVAQ